MNQKTNQYSIESEQGRVTTLCYMKRDGHTLMLYRNKKQDDVNAGKWIGVGGKVEPGEHPDEAVLREIEEETGYRARHCDFRGIILFCYNDNPPETMYLYTTEDFTGEMRECDEGTLRWIRDEDVLSLDLWEGDRILLELIGYRSGGELEFRSEHMTGYGCAEKQFRLVLHYHDDTLMSHKISHA